MVAARDVSPVSSTRVADIRSHPCTERPVTRSSNVSPCRIPPDSSGSGSGASGPDGVKPPANNWIAWASAVLPELLEPHKDCQRSKLHLRPLRVALVPLDAELAEFHYEAPYREEWPAATDRRSGWRRSARAAHPIRSTVFTRVRIVKLGRTCVRLQKLLKGELAVRRRKNVVRAHFFAGMTQPAHLLGLCAAQPISTPAFVTLGLRDPVADRLGGGFELSTFDRQQHRHSRASSSGVRPVQASSTIWRRKAGEVCPRLTACRGRLRENGERSRCRHGGYLLPKGSGVHEIGPTPARADGAARS